MTTFKEFITRYVTNPLLGVPCPSDITNYVNANKTKIWQNLGFPGDGYIQIGFVDQDNVIDGRFRIINDSRPGSAEEKAAQYIQIQNSKLDLPGENYPLELNLRFSNISLNFPRGNRADYTSNVYGYTKYNYFNCRKTSNFLDSRFACFCTNSTKYQTGNPLNVDPTSVPTYNINP